MTATKCAAFTMVRDEEVFLDIWIDYYRKQLSEDSLYIIDHGSSSPVVAPPGVSILRLPRQPLDEIARAQIVSDFNGILMSSYDATIFSDADEIVIPDPRRYSGLLHYLETHDAPLIAGVGLALLQRRSEEGPVNLARPILSQRGFVQFHGVYCKPLVSRGRTGWKAGFHLAAGSYPLDPELYIFHLKAMDYDVAHQYLHGRRGNSQSARMIENNHSSQFRVTDKEFDEIYFRVSEDQFTTARLDFSFRQELGEFARSNNFRLESFGSVRKLPMEFTGAF